MSGGVLQACGKIQGGMNLGCGDLQIPGTGVGPVGRRLSGGPPEFWEGAPSMEPAREMIRREGADP